MLGVVLPWPLEPILAWLPHEAALGAIVALLLAVRAKRPGARRAWSTMALLAMALGAAAVGGTVMASGSPSTVDTQPVRVLLMNLQQGSGQAEAVAARLTEAEVDVVVLVEVDAAWASALNEPLAAWPHRWSELRDDRFGLLVASVWPLSPALRLAVADIPMVRLEVEGPAPFSLVAVHLAPPVGSLAAEVQAAQLVPLRELVDGAPNPVVVAGDLNLTPWMPSYAEIIGADLRSVRRGAGYLASWPSVLGPLGLPIDHVLVGDAVSLGTATVVEDFGSDHRGLRVELRVPTSRGQLLRPGVPDLR